MKVGRVRACIAGLAIAAVCAGASSSAAEALPANFWGVVPQTTPTADQYARLKQGGVDSVRIPILWESIQPTKESSGVWSGVDELVGAAASAGIDVFPFLYGAPSWAVRQVPVPGSGGSIRAPKTLPVHSGVQRTGWSRFLKLAVWRYGPKGSFWTEHPAIPRHPIRTWQIWNEENFKYFVARPNPAEYGQLVKLSYAALKGADRGAKVVLGGLFAHPIEATRGYRPPQAYFASDFLQRMYSSTPGVKRKFDGVALHPYTGRYQRLTPYIEEVRRVLAANHDAGKGLWITELGWSSSRPQHNNSFAKGVGGQKRQLQGAFRLLKQRQRKWRVQRVYWFSVDDLPGSCNFCDGSGLFGAGFAPKPAWYAFVRFAGGRPG